MHTILLATTYPGGMGAILFAFGWFVAVGLSLCGLVATVIVLIGKRSRHLVPNLAAFSAVLAFISLLSIGVSLLCETSDPDVMRDKALYDRMLKETISSGVGSVVLMGIGIAIAIWGINREQKAVVP